MLALGTFALLQQPGAAGRAARRPALADKAVEELLRYLSVVKAFDDGRRWRTSSWAARPSRPARRSSCRSTPPTATPSASPTPTRSTCQRQDGGHLAFGHGIHQCLGQQLARVEMRVAFPALVNRFPTLRLAVPAEEVGLRPETADIYGVKSLPVTWDA